MSDTELNLAFISGVVCSALDHRQGDWGSSVDFSIRHFVKRFNNSQGQSVVIEHEFKMSCQTRTKQENTCYAEVRTLAPGDWVLLRYQLDQAQYEKNGEPRTWDKRMVVGLEAVRRASTAHPPQAVSSDPAAEPPLPF